VAIAFGDASASQRALGAVARGAIARNGPDHFGFAHRGSVWFIQRERLRAFRRPLHNSPAAALANGTICSRHEGSLASAAANSNVMEDCAKCGTCGISGREETAREILQPARAKIAGFRLTALAGPSLFDADSVARAGANDGVAGFAIIN